MLSFSSNKHSNIGSLTAQLQYYFAALTYANMICVAIIHFNSAKQSLLNI